MPEPTLSDDQKIELATGIAALLPPDTAFFVGVADSGGSKTMSILSNIEGPLLGQILLDLGQSTVDEPIEERESYSVFTPN